MSRSNPVENTLESPVEFTIGWNAEKGKFWLMSDNSDEPEEYDPNFEAGILENNYYRIRGKNKEGLRFRSNMNKNVGYNGWDQTFNVTLDGEDFASGPWKKIKKEVTTEKGKMNRMLFLAIKDGEDFVTILMYLHGMAYAEYNEFEKRIRKVGVDLTNANYILTITGTKEVTDKQHGKTHLMPVFGYRAIGQDVVNEWVEMDKELQKYLSQLNDDPNDDVIAEARQAEEREMEEKVAENQRHLDAQNTNPPPKEEAAAPEVDMAQMERFANKWKANIKDYLTWNEKDEILGEWGRVCVKMERYRMPDQMREEVRSYWEDTIKNDFKPEVGEKWVPQLDGTFGDLPF